MMTRDPEPTAAYQASTHPTPSRPDNGHPVGRSAVPQAELKQASIGFLGRRREARAKRRALAGRQRVVHRVEMLGPHWHIVDYHPEDPDFLAIGPGGIFQVTVADHGRSSVELAGDVVQVDGRRPPYVALARRDAERISQQMSVAAGRRIPVVPVVAFVGSGQVVYYGLPPDGCVVTTYRDLGRALNAHGNRVSESTIQKLLIVAARVDSRTIGQYLDISSEVPSQRGIDR
jgi:hypothetical protein